MQPDRQPYADECEWDQPCLTTPNRIGLALLVAVLAAAVGFAIHHFYMGV